MFCAVVLSSPFVVSAQTGSEVFRQEGIASWYGTEFDGRPTASGEIFNSSLFTAAHPSLPFGTLLNVTNSHNNKTVTVKVNDRGPFVSARIIDISMAAAEQLDMITTGTAPVIIQSVERIVTPGDSRSPDSLWSEPPAPPLEPPLEPPLVQAAPPPAALPPPVYEQPVQRVEITPAEPRPPAAPEQTFFPEPASTVPPVQTANVYQQAAPEAPAAPPPAVAVQPAPPPIRYNPAALIPNIEPLPQKKYRLQVGSYKVARNAVDSFEKLTNAGLNPRYERYEDYFRVVLPDISGADVFSITEKLGSAGFREALIREER